MLTNLFYTLKAHGVPVSIREHLDLLSALNANLVIADQEEFYYLARTVLVKDEKHFDKYDKAFQAFTTGLESLEGTGRHWSVSRQLRSLRLALVLENG